MSVYSVAHIIHLFCAITFVGGVLFESLVLSVLHTKKVSREARREAERALSARAVKVMPWVVCQFFLYPALHQAAAGFQHPLPLSGRRYPYAPPHHDRGLLQIHPSRRAGADAADCVSG